MGDEEDEEEEVLLSQCRNYVEDLIAIWRSAWF
jgi:hypothetical protein